MKIKSACSRLFYDETHAGINRTPGNDGRHERGDDADVGKEARSSCRDNATKNTQTHLGMLPVLAMSEMFCHAVLQS